MGAKARAIFSLNSALWVGVLFLLGSNSPAFYTEKASKNKRMGLSSASLEIVCFLLWLFLNIAFHFGLVQKLKKQCKLAEPEAIIVESDNMPLLENNQMMLMPVHDTAS